MLRFINATFAYNRHKIRDLQILLVNRNSVWHERFYLTVRLKRGWIIRVSRRLS